MTKRHIWFRWPGNEVSRCIACDVPKSDDPGPCLPPARRAAEDVHEPATPEAEDRAT